MPRGRRVTVNTSVEELNTLTSNQRSKQTHSKTAEKTKKTQQIDPSGSKRKVCDKRPMSPISEDYIMAAATASP